MPESTRYAILGLVAREPIHGYAIVAEIADWPVPDELRPGRSSVYRGLKRLYEAQLVQPRLTDVPVDAGRPDRVMYEVTPAGVDQLDRYVRTSPRNLDELFVRISAARPEDLPILFAFAADLEELSLQRFQQYSAGPDAMTLARRGMPWRYVIRALVAQAQAADVASHATILGDLRSNIEALQREP